MSLYGLEFVDYLNIDITGVKEIEIFRKNSDTFVRFDDNKFYYIDYKLFVKDMCRPSMSLNEIEGSVYYEHHENLDNEFCYLIKL